MKTTKISNTSERNKQLTASVMLSCRTNNRNVNVDIDLILITTLTQPDMDEAKISSKNCIGFKSITNRQGQG